MERDSNELALERVIPQMVFCDILQRKEMLSKSFAYGDIIKITASIH